MSIATQSIARTTHAFCAGARRAACAPCVARMRTSQLVLLWQLLFLTMLSYPRQPGSDRLPGTGGSTTPRSRVTGFPEANTLGGGSGCSVRSIRHSLAQDRQRDRERQGETGRQGEREREGETETFPAEENRRDVCPHPTQTHMCCSSQTIPLSTGRARPSLAPAPTLQQAEQASILPPPAVPAWLSQPSVFPSQMVGNERQMYA